jgi:hypothetical protein
MRIMQIAFVVCIALAPLCLTESVAGPYFNTSRKEVDGQSREAVKQLSDARILIIRMFTDLDMGQMESARTERSQAINLLQLAVVQFQDIETKAPNQPLRFSISSDEDKRIVGEFTQELVKRKLDFPKTEKELARLAVVVVKNYLVDVQKANLEGFPKNWRGVRQIILSEVDLLTIGNLVSIVWIISE